MTGGKRLDEKQIEALAFEIATKVALDEYELQKIREQPRQFAGFFFETLDTLVKEFKYLNDRRGTGAWAVDSPSR